jgi:hypothetical protein
MRLINDDRIVTTQQPIVLDLGEQDSVRHHLDQRFVTAVISEPDLVANDSTEFDVELFCYAIGDAPRSNTSRLGVPDLAIDPSTHLKQDLRQLCGLAAPGLPSDDDNLVCLDGGPDLIPHQGHRQIGIGDGRNEPAPKRRSLLPALLRGRASVIAHLECQPTTR